MYTATSEESVDVRSMTPRFNYEGPFKKAVEIARHYGFQLVEPVQIKKKGKKKGGRKNDDIRYLEPHYREALFEHYKDELSHFPQPLMICHTRHHRRKVGHLTLQVYGSPKSISEALVLRAGLAILTDHGHRNLHVDINSLGNRHSFNNFREEFLTYYRKNLNSLGECCQADFRNDPLTISHCESEPCSRLREGAPRSIAFLSESGRVHLKEIIEYIEAMNASYRINSDLLGSEHTPSKTLFQIKSLKKKTNGEIKETTIVGRGDRFDYLSLKLGEKEVIPAVALTIDVEGGGGSETYEEIDDHLSHSDRPKIYFIHLGVEAKRASMVLLEELRKTRIPLMQSLIQDSLSRQLRIAEKMNVPYAIIMGLKEVNERCVIVRDMFTHAQESIPINSLSDYLKKVVK